MDNVYPEVHVSVGDPVVLPQVCPVCGAGVGESDSVGERWMVVGYVCGGKYRPKPQIQNHTDKWWGHCGR